MHVVLVEPDIAANTGNIARLCVAAGATLHLIRPLGFFLSDPRLKRAGLDYWQYLELQVHDSFADFLVSQEPQRMYFVETGGRKLYSQVCYEPGDYLVFGSETKGLSGELINAYSDHVVSLPQRDVRSLNLANTVAIVVYEAWRQLGFAGAKNLPEAGFTAPDQNI
ncbi:MAG: tRNA (cytidine(34)-2'-O)-methyltransferase [Limnochordia bacterium]|jgi:tRNA (cytidine/uridine-2'-O-)-methyltransferase|nr:tRNA (cytidine(34)-2'-O)-methyltransferase [Bacillota bacterium]NLL08048.1 tRNA (cytidine(34)-2'-O)-methyltransferase [Bacillota bacterium]HBG09828.1 tRNA (uridine(34)/cytosine(34)/5-carboxymethylaminomethyluridine(34)-2'-O)-methyltransferase TrmL [Bacillota bacterium]